MVGWLHVLGQENYDEKIFLTENNGYSEAGMKFGKSLSNQIEETLPEWRDQFLSYKELKKKLKSIDPRAAERPTKRQRVDSAEGGADSTVDGMTDEEIEFIKLLEDELDKFNKFFEEKEEDYIIRMKIIQDEVEKAKNSNEETLKIKKEIVDFHGEMVLLENYSALNYTGLVKILKKYDKRTGALIRLPFIQRVLQQPFFSTDLIYSLVKECERMLDLLFPKHNPTPSTTGDYIPDTTTTTEDSAPLQLPMELAEIEKMEGLYMKSTVSALRSLKEIRSRSSTVSEFSLPPLQISGFEEPWKKTPVLEQVAK